MMSPADYLQIRNNTSRIEALEGQTKRLLYTASTNPTQQQIQTFVDSYLTSIGVTPSAEAYQGIAVVVAGTYHIWHYYNTQGVGWKDDGLDTVSQFTNSSPGVIQGKQADGFVYAENDGIGSVYGWSQLKARVSNLETSAQTVSYDNTSGSEAFKQTINGATTTLVLVSDLRTALNIPEDTGATSVEPTGSGNAFTGASYDASTRKITLVKGETFALDSNLYNYSTDIIIDEQTSAMSFAITSDVFNKLKTSRFATITLTNPTGAAYTFHKLGYVDYDNVETLTFTTEVNSGNNLTASVAFDGTDYTTLVEITQVSANASGTTVGSYKRLDSITVDNQTYDLAHSYEKAFSDGSATIASLANDIITLKAGVQQADGSISNATGSDITLAKVAKTGSYNDLSDKPTIPTVPVQDVTVNGTSVLDGTTAKILTKTINGNSIVGTGNIETPNDNYYQTPTFDNTNGALKIATGTGVNDLYVPQATTSQKGLVIVSTGLNINTDSSSADFGKLTLGSHASANTTYGVGSTTNYGHVKLATGDMNGATHADGVAASKDHTHSQYALATDIPTNYVTTDTTQTIIGAKTFNEGIALANDKAIISGGGLVSLLSYNGTTNCIVIGSSLFLPGDVLISAKTGQALAPSKGLFNAEINLDLGKSSQRWKDLYMVGKIKDGNNSSYGLSIPDTTSYTADKTIATTSDFSVTTTKGSEAVSANGNSVPVRNIYYVEGDTTGTSPIWTATCSDITSYYTGLTITFKIGIAGLSGTQTTLNINSLGAKKVFENVSTNPSTHYSVGTVLFMVYDETLDSGNGAWKISGDRVGTDGQNVRTYNYTTSNYDRDLLCRQDTAAITAGSYTAKYVATTTKAKINTSTGLITSEGGFALTNGTSSQFLKADGSTDSNSYLKEITSSDVTAALGYTPYNSTNPSGYTSNTGTVTSVTINTSGTGLSVSSTSAITTSGTRTITLKSSSAGNANATDYPVVLRNANGTIQSDTFAVSSSGTTKANITYDSTNECIKFTF